MSSDAPRRLRRLQDADLDGKVVLVRVDHNCVRRGALTDAFRVDATFATLYNIVERGGRPVLMTHVGRPYDKKSKKIAVDDDDAATCVARYLQARLGVTFAVPDLRHRLSPRPYGKSRLGSIPLSSRRFCLYPRQFNVGAIYVSRRDPRNASHSCSSSVTPMSASLSQSRRDSCTRHLPAHTSSCAAKSAACGPMRSFPWMASAYFKL